MHLRPVIQTALALMAAAAPAAAQLKSVSLESPGSPSYRLTMYFDTTVTPIELSSGAKSWSTADGNPAVVAAVWEETGSEFGFAGGRLSTPIVVSDSIILMRDDTDGTAPEVLQAFIYNPEPGVALVGFQCVAFGDGTGPIETFIDGESLDLPDGMYDDSEAPNWQSYVSIDPAASDQVNLGPAGNLIEIWTPTALPADAAEADVTTTGSTLEGQAGYGEPDGNIDLDDLGYFLNLWLAG